MKSVFMIAYPFPPEGAATSYRTLRFVRQLPKRGWNATVITALPSQYERYDLKLLALIPKETEVIQAKGYDLWQGFQSWRYRRIQTRHSGDAKGWAKGLGDGQPSNVRSRMREMVRTAEAWWYQPDMAMPWIKPAIKAAMEVCAHQRPNVIWANAGRVSAFFIAERVSQRTGVPYVLDFDDAWTIVRTGFEYKQPWWATRSVRRKMYRLLNGAQAVVFRYDTEAECFWRAYRGALDASKVYIIPNGYESPIEEFVAPVGKRCTILYAGTLPDYRYDTLLQSLRLLKETNLSKARQLRFLFVGEGIDALANQAASLGLSDIIETTGPKPYAEIASLHREAHALLVLGRPATMKGHELFAGAKVFGYLKAGRPIVGILPDDETKKVLHRVGVRTVADVESVTEIMGVLSSVLHNWSTNSLESLIPDRKACKVYSSEHQTAILVRALEGVPSEEPFIPGAQTIPPSLRAAIENDRWLDGSC